MTPDGGPVKGEFVVTISAKPPRRCVTGSGKVVTNCRPGELTAVRVTAA